MLKFCVYEIKDVATCPLIVVLFYMKICSKAMRSVKRYVSSAKNPEFRIIPMAVITVINVRIPLRNSVNKTVTHCLNL